MTSASRAAPAPAARVCGTRQIRPAVERFFTDWNSKDRRAFGRLFRNGGELDMATRGQDTLHRHAWSAAVGPGQVAAFAARQWARGEVLSFHGMTVYPGPARLGGAEVNDVAARFADGAVQPIEEAKFNYNCAAATFTHVVIISAGTAAKK